MGKHSAGSGGSERPINNADFIAGKVSRKDRRKSDLLGPADDQATRNMPTFEAADGEYSSAEAAQAYRQQMPGGSAVTAAGSGVPEAAATPPTEALGYDEQPVMPTEALGYDEQPVMPTQHMPEPDYGTPMERTAPQPAIQSGPPPAYIPGQGQGYDQGFAPVQAGMPPHDDDDDDDDDEQRSPTVLILSIILVALLLIIAIGVAWAFLGSGDSDEELIEPTETVETEESTTPSETPTRDESTPTQTQQQPAPQPSQPAAPQPQPAPTQNEPSQPSPEQPNPDGGGNSGNSE